MKQLIVSKPPKFIKVADKPISLGGKIEDYTLAQFKEKFGYAYGEGVWWNEERQEVRPEQWLQAKSSLVTGIPESTLCAQIAKILENPPEYLVLCKINDKIGYGLFTTQKISKGTVILIYSGEICRPSSLDSHGYSLMYYETDFCYRTTISRGLGSFMQHLPNYPETPNLDILEATLQLFGQKVDKMDLRLDNEWYNLTFTSPQAQNSLAFENVQQEYLVYDNIPVIALVAKTDIEPNSQLGFKYGCNYWLAKRQQPELFDRAGDIMPHTLYRRIWGALFFKDFMYIGDFLPLITQLKTQRSIEIIGTDGQKHIVGAKELAEQLFAANAIASDSLKQTPALPQAEQEIFTKLKALVPEPVGTKWKYDLGKNMFWLRVKEREPYDAIIAKQHLETVFTVNKIAKEEAYCIVSTAEHLKIKPI